MGVRRIYVWSRAQTIGVIIMADSWTKRTGGSTVWANRAGNVSGPVTWTSSTRPTADLFNGKTGFNSTIQGLEVYLSDSAKWLILSGTWTTATRPATTNLATGSRGINTDSGFGLEMWDGEQWALL